MTPIMITILLIALFAGFYARQQAQLYWPFRELNDQQFSMTEREALSRRAHALGLAVCIIICAGLALIEALYRFRLISMAGLLGRTWLHLLCLVCCYSLVFDIAFALSFKQKWYYLGESAASDRSRRRLLGMQAGKLKALICALAMAICLFIIKRFL